MDATAIGADTVYSTLKELGMAYGPSHRSVVRIHRGKKQLLAQLKVPAFATTADQAYRLHPGIVDGALQAAIGLIDDLRPNRTLFPFAVDALRIFAACPHEAYAWVRAASDAARQSTFARVDIDLCDREGNVCVQLHGLSVRAGSDGLLGGRPRSETGKPAASAQEQGVFDDAYYLRMIEQVADRVISVEEAVELS
jgi:hypothetical protein